MNFSTLNKQRKCIMVAALAGIISIFLPWVTISAGIFGESISNSTNGFHGIGILSFLSFAVAGIVAFVGDNTKRLDKNLWFAALGAGTLSLLGVLIFMLNMSGSLGSMGIAEAGFGFGLWIALLAALGVAGSAWVFKAPDDTIKSGFESIKNNISTPNNSFSGSKASELEKLIELKSSGKISEEEYEKLKSKLF